MLQLTFLHFECRHVILKEAEEYSEKGELIWGLLL